MGSTQALKNQRAWLALLAKVKAKQGAPAPPPALAGSDQRTPAAAPAAPGAAPAAPHADPFYNAQDLIDLGNINFETATGVQDIDDSIKNLGVDTTYQLGQNDTNAKQNTGATNDNAAGRGIFGSSIQQGALADIEANRVIQKNYLENHLETARIQGEARKTAIRKHATDVIGGLDQHAVGNADEINKQIPGAAPAPAAPAAPAVPDLIKQWQDQSFTAVAGTDSKGRPGVWHHPKNGGPPVFIVGATR